MSIILLRHGRTQANARGLLQGRIDPDLDDLGRAQAQAAGEWIGPVDRIIASSLARAQQTAAALAGVDPTVGVEIDDRFVEIDYGEWEGRPVADVDAETWRAWRADLDFRPPGGETLSELGARVRAGLDELAAQATDYQIVVVSHVSPMKAATAWALGVDDQVTWRMRLAQAAICRIELMGGRPQLTEFNTTAHLRSL